jgi:hypothetical protein
LKLYALSRELRSVVDVPHRKEQRFDATVVDSEVRDFGDAGDEGDGFQLGAPRGRGGTYAVNPWSFRDSKFI